MRELTRKEAERKAFEGTKYTLAELVGEEVYDWSDEKVRTEACKSAEIMLSERQEPFYSVLEERALTAWKDDLPRMPMEYLATDDKKTAVLEYDVWPNSMDKWELEGILNDHKNNHGIPSWYWQKGYDPVFEGIMEKLTDFKQ